MEEIKVGEYVRTNKGTIRKTVEVLNSIVIADKHYYEPYCITEAISKRDIVKHSPNIIDLVQEGDYVNGKRVSTIQESKDTSNNIIIKELWCYFDLHFCSIIREDEIKDIVTKEQFNQVKYEV